jgi:hypothetical protein
METLERRPDETQTPDSAAEEPLVRTFQCVNCQEDLPWSQRIFQTFKFQNKLETYDVSVTLCTKCFMEGGLHPNREKEIVQELSDAQKGMRW